jgi:hypothetical protein
MSSQNFTKTNVSERQASTACTLPNLQFFSRQAGKEHPVLRKLTLAASQIIGKVGSSRPFSASQHHARTVQTARSRTAQSRLPALIGIAAFAICVADIRCDHKTIGSVPARGVICSPAGC